MRRTAVTVFCASLLLSTSALASGFGLRESSASSLGLSYAGVAANGSHASTLTFNPGLLGDVNEFDVSSSAIGLLPETDGTFAATTTQLSPLVPPTVLGGTMHPKDIVNTALIPALGVRYRLTDQFIVGLTLSSPWGLTTDYGPDSVTRYYNIKSDVKTVNITPMIGWQPVPEFTLGVGFQLQYIKGNLTKAIDFGTIGAANGIPFAVPGAMDGNVALKAQDWGEGFVIGAEWKPCADLSFGLSYRSAIDNTLKGKELFTLDPAHAPYPSVGATLAAVTGMFADGPATAKFTTPYVITFGAKWKATDQLTVLVGGDYTGWNSFKDLIAHSANPVQPDDVTVFDFKNSWYGSVGVEYKPNQDWTLRLGTAYDQTPTTDEFRTPGIPDGSRYWISAGVGYRLTDNMDVDVSIARLTAQKGNISLNQLQEGNL
ncbi:MAG TPA: outer membrane protein transport protein, partial [Rhizomicrobium sp.]|nr:outer membrane protein transport protein [Rhizomicrobium sp.]